MSKRNEVVTRLYANDLRCVAQTKAGLYESTLSGIKPLMIKLREDRSFFEGAVVADRVIGKAAAMLLAASGVQEVFGAVMSESAEQFLKQAGISYGYCEKVPYIKNRTGDGMCPMEETVQSLTDAQDAFDALEQTIARLMANK